MTQSADDKNKLVAESEISLVLDTYDDIFSGFDPRPYDHRVLSFDFLVEAKRAAREKVAGLSLLFMIPEALRDLNKEKLIIKRLHSHFEKHANLLKKEKKISQRKGFFITLLGFLFTSCAAGISFQYKESMTAAIALVLLEPAGWFSIWNGLDLLFQAGNLKKDELEFYHKMATAEIIFNSY